MNHYTILSSVGVRLLDGRNWNEGRVEIFYNGSWGTVCDDQWDNLDAQVVCRQLGLPDFGAQAHAGAHFGEGHGKIILDDVECVGTETSLDQCQHSGSETRDCSHDKDVGVTCGLCKIYA